MNENFPRPLKTIHEASRIINEARETCAETHAVFNRLADLAVLTVKEKKICRKALDNTMAVSMGIDKPYKNILSKEERHHVQ
jgi:hypothetical protein